MINALFFLLFGFMLLTISTAKGSGHYLYDCYFTFVLKTGLLGKRVLYICKEITSHSD